MLTSFSRRPVAAALAALALTVGNGAHAVNVNSQGRGEALIYPYYTTRNGQATLLSMVNGSRDFKAVRVRFREGKTGADVFSFNLFLAPLDVWTAAVVDGDGGARIVTNDQSCTRPVIFGRTDRAFTNLNYQTDEPSLRSLDRTREGYIEVIEMASIVSDSATADTTFNNRYSGLPQACADLIDDANLAKHSADYLPPTGGLFGSGTIVSQSMSTGYDAVALQGLNMGGGITPSDSAVPDWTDVRNKTTLLVDGETASTPRIISAKFSRGLDAVTASLMAARVTGEYSYDNTFATDWVFTMPTRRLYVKAKPPNAQVPIPYISGLSFDRESVNANWYECFASPPENEPSLFWSVSVMGISANKNLPQTGALMSTNSVPWRGIDGCDDTPPYQRPNQPGGIGDVSFAYSGGPYLISEAGSTVTTIDGDGNSASKVGALTFFGIPVIGWSVSIARFAKSNDNFNSSYSLKVRRAIE